MTPDQARHKAEEIVRNTLASGLDIRAAIAAALLEAAKVPSDALSRIANVLETYPTDRNDGPRAMLEYCIATAASASHATALLEAANNNAPWSSHSDNGPKAPKGLRMVNGKVCAPESHLLDAAGVVRRVLGTLPLTADGCVVGADCDHDCFDVHGVGVTFLTPNADYLLRFYSSKEAAEAARSKA